jgi:transcriptional regulator with XRE-family HTH domain
LARYQNTLEEKLQRTQTLKCQKLVARFRCCLTACRTLLHLGYSSEGTQEMKLSKENIRKEFARRLQNLLNERGWVQAELARRMAPYLKDRRIGRDNISKYVRGRVLPLPPALEAMAKVFGVESRELLPNGRGAPTVEEEANRHCERCDALRKELDRAREDAAAWRDQVTFLREEMRGYKDLVRILTPYGRNRGRVPPRTPQRPAGAGGNGGGDQEGTQHP